MSFLGLNLIGNHSGRKTNASARKIFPMRQRPIFCLCFHTPRVMVCIPATVRITPHRISSPAIGDPRGSMYCSRWGGMRSGCPRSSMPSRQASIRVPSRPGTWKDIGAKLSAMVSPSIGIEKLTQPIPVITGGPSGYSFSFSNMDWPMWTRNRYGGVPP